MVPVKYRTSFFSLSLYFHCLPLDDMVGLSLSSYMDEKKNPLYYRPNNIPSNHFFRKVSQTERGKRKKEMMIALDGDNSRKWDVEAWMVGLCKKSRKANEILLLLSLSFGAFQFFR